MRFDWRTKKFCLSHCDHPLWFLVGALLTIGPYHTVRSARANPI